MFDGTQHHEIFYYGWERWNVYHVAESFLPHKPPSASTWKLQLNFIITIILLFKVQLKQSLTDLPTCRKRKSRDFEKQWTKKGEIRIMGLLYELIMWSTFGKHENSSLLKHFVSSSWKRALKLGNLYIFNCIERAKKAVSDSPGLVDFAIRLVISFFNLPDQQVMFFWGIRITEELWNQFC